MNNNKHAHTLANISQLLAELKNVLGENYVLSHPMDLAAYESDAETLDTARPDLVVLPATTEEVVAVVKLANAYNIPFVPRGAGTGLSGGATTIGGGISLVLTRMNKILELNAESLYARVQVGVTNLSVSQAAMPMGLYYAPDPSSQAASTIGGNIAENAGGPHTLKYGMTVDHILGIELVLPSGEVTTVGGKCNNRLELDWLALLIGSEGTLGLVTEAIVRLSPMPSAVETMAAYFFDLESGGKAVSDLIALGVIPCAMEMIDQLTLNAVEDSLKLGLDREADALLIVELAGSKQDIAVQKDIVEKTMAANQVKNMAWATDSQARALLWKARKSAFGALGRIAPDGYVLDGVIPRSCLAEAIGKIKGIAEKYKITIANIYHAGDGNLHPCLLYCREDKEQVERVILAGQDILQMCVDLGGTLSGEHGIGIEKLSAMPYVFNPTDLRLMSILKETFDPKSICNPGKILPSTRLCGESGARTLLRHNLAISC